MKGDKKDYSLRIINLICISDLIFCTSYGCFDFILYEEIRSFKLLLIIANINDYGFGLSSGYIVVIALVTYRQMV